MKFTYDGKKSTSNLEKHGIDFEQVQELWYSDMLLFQVRARGEKRTLGIGRIAGEYWTVIYKQETDQVRIISARRSMPRERSSYDRYINS